MGRNVYPPRPEQGRAARVEKIVAIYKLIEQVSDIDLEYGEACYEAALRVLERQRFRPDGRGEQRNAA